MSKQQYSTTNANPMQKIGENLSQVLPPELVVMLVVSLLGIGLLKLMGSKQGELADAYFGGRQEMIAAMRSAQTQLKHPKIGQTALYAGINSGFGTGTQMQTYLTGRMPCLPLPNAQQSLIVCGAPDGGKTYSIFDPAIRSSLLQGFPVIVYDTKGSQLEAHAAFAARLGYEVYVFAPGKKIGGRINPLDFMNDHRDSSMAEQMAISINRNVKIEVDKSDAFFGPSGDKLVRAILQLAKATEQPDLVTAKRLLNLKKLDKRLENAIATEQLDPWVADSYGQFLQTADSAETVAGVAATAALAFDSFTRPEFMSSFIGKSTIPLDFTGKQILFLLTDLEKADVVTPVIATVLDLLVSRNFGKPRDIPLVLSLDEFPTLYLPNIKKWVNVYRSLGLVCLLGFQSFPQIKSRYGENVADEIFTGCGTKIFFTPNEIKTAKDVSEYLGTKEIVYGQTSKSSGKGGGSTSDSQQKMRVPLWSPEDVNRMDQGECIVINAGYKGKRNKDGVGRKTRIPLHVQIRLPEIEVELQKQSISLWRKNLKAQFEEINAQYHLDWEVLTAELKARMALAEATLPLEQQTNEASDEVLDLPPPPQELVAKYETVM